MGNNLKIFCVTNKELPKLENSHLLMAGVGVNKFNKKYLDCSTKKNIFEKEKYYSELTFHYWYWKNLLKHENTDWVGFCQKEDFGLNLNLLLRKLIQKI